MSGNVAPLPTLGVKLQSFASKELRLGNRLAVVIVEAEAVYSAAFSQKLFKLMFAALFIGLLLQYTFLGQHIRSILIKHNFIMALATRLLVQTELFIEQQRTQVGQSAAHSKDVKIEVGRMRSPQPV